MDSDRHVVTHAIDRPKGIRARTQVSDLTEEFQRVSLLLQGIGSRICRPEDFKFVCLYFYALPLTLRGDEFADHAEACPRGDLSEKISVEACEVDDDLDIMDRRASFSAMKLIALLPRRVRTQPLTFTCCPTSEP